MTNCYPNHLSHHFELSLSKLPTKSCDRFPICTMIIGIFFGILLASLGVGDFIYGQENISSSLNLKSQLFDSVLFILGLGIVLALIISYRHFRKIYFDGKNFSVVSRINRKKMVSFKEPIGHYSAVRMRIEFFMCGFLNRNRYIIELYHKNPQKIIPLFISTSDRFIHEKWQFYAKTFNLPTMVQTNDGPQLRQVQDLGKSVTQLICEGIITPNFDLSKTVPDTLIVKKTDNKTIIKLKNRLWDAYNLVALAGVLFFATLWLVLGGLQYPLDTLSDIGKVLYILSGGFIFLSFALLFRREKLIIKKHKIVNIHKFASYSRKNNEIIKDNIEGIETSVNPASGRHFITIISRKKTIIFGKILPLNDQVWLKNFLLQCLSS